jgi:hypothetical protein
LTKKEFDMEKGMIPLPLSLLWHAKRAAAERRMWGRTQKTPSIK